MRGQCACASDGRPNRSHTGVLFKEAVSLEQAAKIQAIIFDKTGTLTEGKPRVTDVVPVAGFSADELLRLEAAAEARSHADAGSGGARSPALA